MGNMQWARQQLAHEKERARTDRPLLLEDWLLPLHYQQGEVPPFQPQQFASVQAEAAGVGVGVVGSGGGGVGGVGGGIKNE